MHDRADHRIEHFVEDPLLACEKPARATKPRLDFIGDEQGSVFSAEFQRSLQIAIVRKDDALSLNRLDEESRDRARSQCLLQRGKIVEGYLDTFRQKRAETC